MLQLGKQCCCYIKLLSVCVRSCMHSDSVHLCAVCPNDNLRALYQKASMATTTATTAQNMYILSYYIQHWIQSVYEVAIFLCMIQCVSDWVCVCVCMNMINIFQCLECLALPHSHLTVASTLSLPDNMNTHTHSQPHLKMLLMNKFYNTCSCKTYSTSHPYPFNHSDLGWNGDGDSESGGGRYREMKAPKNIYMIQRCTIFDPKFVINSWNWLRARASNFIFGISFIKHFFGWNWECVCVWCHCSRYDNGTFRTDLMPLSTLNSERNFYALPFSICKAYGFHQIIINHLYHGRFWDDAPSLPQHLLGVHHVSTVTKYSRAVTRAKRVCFLLFIYFCRKYFHIIHENSLCWHVKGLKVETMTWKISCTLCSTRNTCVWLFVLIIHLFQFNITEKKNLLCPTNSSVSVLQMRSNTREKNNRSKIFRFLLPPQNRNYRQCLFSM